MIDPHVHLRDWAQREKETVRHGLEVARRAGLDGVFEMPNTSPPLTTLGAIEERIELADAACRELGGGIVHGLYAGVTADPEQLSEVVRAHAALFPRVVGLKLYAGHSTGRMGVVGEEAQLAVYRSLASLGYRGVLAVHAEKESLLASGSPGAPAWDPRRPSSHARARPPEAETASVEDQIRFASESGFRGSLHICHLSVPAALGRIQEARGSGRDFRLSCGVTPHHALLAVEEMDSPGGLLLKMNPPLRPREMQDRILRALLSGEIDLVETDHAPHTLRDKLEAHASGIPVFPFYPHFLSLLARAGMSPSALERAAHRSAEELFGFSVPRNHRAPQTGLEAEYPFDPFSRLRVSSGLSG